MRLNLAFYRTALFFCHLDNGWALLECGRHEPHRLSVPSLESHSAGTVVRLFTNCVCQEVGLPRLIVGPRECLAALAQFPRLMIRRASGLTGPWLGRGNPRSAPEAVNC
jgi:hypothetical protein